MDRCGPARIHGPSIYKAVFVQSLLYKRKQGSLFAQLKQNQKATAQEAGLPLGMVRTNEEFLKERQFTEVLSSMPLITLEKIGESEPVPFKPDGKSPLDGIRALGMGHVIAGAASGLLVRVNFLKECRDSPSVTGYRRDARRCMFVARCSVS